MYKLYCRMIVVIDSSGDVDHLNCARETIREKEKKQIKKKTYHQFHTL